MKKIIKPVLGIVLLIFGVLSIIGRAAENAGNHIPWYVVSDDAIQAITTLTSNFMLFVGGIILLIPTKKKNNITTSINTGNKNCVSVPDFQPFQPNVQSNGKNGLCIAAFVLGIIGCFFVGVIKVPVLPVVSLILACVGMKQADYNEQGGAGFGKWAITLSTSAILGVICWLIMSGTNIFGIENKKTASDVYDELISTSMTKLQNDDDFGKIQNNDNFGAEKEYSKGIVTSESYESEFVGLRFTLPANWVMRTEEEIVELFGSDAADQCEMSIFNSITGEAINLIVEKIPSKNMTIEQCVKSLEHTFTENGMILISDDETVDFNGEEYWDVIFDMKQSGVTLKTELYLRKENDRLVYLTLQYLDGNRANIEPALNAFSRY